MHAARAQHGTITWPQLYTLDSVIQCLNHWGVLN